MKTKIIVICGLLLIGSCYMYWPVPNLPNVLAINDRDGVMEVNLRQLGKFEIDQHMAGNSDIPADVRELDGKCVTMVGEVWQPDGGSDACPLQTFQLVYSLEGFGEPSGPRKIQWFVFCTVGNAVPAEDRRICTAESVRVTGTLHVGILRDSDGYIDSLFRLDVAKLEPIE